MKRRNVLQLLPVLAGSMFLPVLINTTNPAKPVFVLVHGAWHGGWCWKKVKALLNKRGYDVYTPTLTGLGERSHLLKADINLDTHIQDVVNVIEYEDLNNVVLVGHSYAGMVVTGVADRIPSRISHLLYLDAFMPDNGKALKDYTPPPPPGLPQNTSPEAWKVAPRETAKAWGIREENNIVWAQKRLGPQSGATFGQPLVMSAPLSEKITKGFVLLTNDSPWFLEAAQRARSRSYHYFEMLKGGHDAMISEPEEVGNILIEFSGK